MFIDENKQDLECIYIDRLNTLVDKECVKFAFGMRDVTFQTIPLPLLFANQHCRPKQIEINRYFFS